MMTMERDILIISSMRLEDVSYNFQENACAGNRMMIELMT
jgi:hypothetical protein